MMRTVDSLKELQGMIQPKETITFTKSQKLCLSALAVMILSSFFFSIRINTSNSLAQYVFVVQKGNLPTKGEFASFYHPLCKTSVVKRVEGVSGDSVSIQEDKLFVSGEFKGTLLTHNSLGDGLIPTKDQVIPEGYYFVKGDHARSFDSRYASFGLIHFSQMEGRAWAPF